MEFFLFAAESNSVLQLLGCGVSDSNNNNKYWLSFLEIFCLLIVCSFAFKTEQPFLRTQDTASQHLKLYATFIKYKETHSFSTRKLTMNESFNIKIKQKI